MSETIVTEHYREFRSSDDNGEFFVRICTDGGWQLQIEAEDGEECAAVNVDKGELTAIRDMINDVLGTKEPAFLGLEHAKYLKPDQLVLCRCPDWCDEGYIVATWTDERFYYSGEPNSNFHKTVIAFMPLDEDGTPLTL